MNLQREDIHPVQDTCPYFKDVFRRILRLHPLTEQLLGL